jgi:hypothetical protein
MMNEIFSRNLHGGGEWSIGLQIPVDPATSIADCCNGGTPETAGLGGSEKIFVVKIPQL